MKPLPPHLRERIERLFDADDWQGLMRWISEAGWDPAHWDAEPLARGTIQTIAAQRTIAHLRAQPVLRTETELRRLAASHIGLTPAALERRIRRADDRRRAAKILTNCQSR